MGKDGQRTTVTWVIGVLLVALLTLVFLKFGYRSRVSTDPVGAPLNTAVASHVADSNTDPDKAPLIPLPLAASVLTSNLPISFEPNEGQTDSQVRFLARASGYNVFLTSTEAVFALRRDTGEKAATLLTAPDEKRDGKRLSVLRMTLKGANASAIARGTEQLPGVRNYLIGANPRAWRTGVPTFRGVRYETIYPGVDLSYYVTQQQLEYDFEVAPGADPNQITLECVGTNGLLIDRAGDLVLKVNGGELRQHKPVVYQQIDGQRVAVNGRFLIRSGREIGFEIGEYDHDHTLVIDPTFVYSTFLGTTGNDLGNSIDIDNAGNIYITGTTNSISFPVQGAYQSTNAGLEDVFVTKLNPSGSSIVYSTYIGGSGNDHGDGLFVDRTSGAAYVVGRIDALSVNFPATSGAFATTYRGGDFDAFVLKLTPQGNGLGYSTFLGGEENDSAVGVVADSAGNAYVTGGTRSTGFPATPNAYQSFVAGDTDAYLVKINPSGSSLLYATLFGGGATDRGSSVKVDNSGNVYFVGYTSSLDFPTLNAFQDSLAGGFDAFITKIDPSQSGSSSLVFCSYLGGVSDEKGYGLALDSSNSIYVAGQTSSTDFPVLNPVQAARGGSFDAFIAKVTSAGAKVYATYLGGSGDDRATGIAVNSSGNAYVTGYTGSTNFPTAIPLQLSNGGGTDAFVAKLSPAGNGLVYSTYLGGSANENFASTTTFSGNIVVDAGTNAYVTGLTASSNFPTAAPFQSANAGGASDAFIARISDAGPTADFSVSGSPSSQTVNQGNSTQYTISVTPSGGFTGNVGLVVTGLPTGATPSFNPASINITDSNARTSVVTISTTAATTPGTYPLIITATAGNLQHSTSVSLIIPGPTGADLSIADTASPNPGIVGATLTYRIIVTNNGPSPATNVTVTDPLPAGVTFVSATPTQGTCSGTSTIICSLGSVAATSSATVSLAVVPQTTGQLTNNANVVASESDPDNSNNTSTLTTTVTTPSTGPSMLDPNLSVRTVVTGLSQPTCMAFIGPNDFLILEKDTGKVRRVTNGVIQSTVLDLAVNNASERGLLGIALHPGFTFNGFVYLYWTESSTGMDTGNLADVPLLGNRVDRYIWNGTVLTFDRNLIRLRAYQADANQPLRGNHNGGILRFGLDGKIYILMGDNGRRGFLQNVTSGAPVPDDQYGGPEPDNAHLTGFILRLNDDGSTPTDNPFFNVATTLTGEAAANIKKLFAYGVRNGFGMAFDPLSGNLWDQENGDDAFDEMNRVTAGSNNGWVQVMGPLGRVAQYKQIETTYGAGNLQQLRWAPTLIADTPQVAVSRLYMLPGAHYNDPEFSWKYAVPASPLGFVQGRGLGPQFEGDMFVGAARTFLSGGFLFRFKLTPDRLHFMFSDSRLNDLVADNLDKFDITESESLLIGKDFGITTDIQTGPNGNLFIVSNTNAAVYEISGTQPKLFVANLSGPQEVPPNTSTAIGTATLLLSPDETSAKVSLSFSGLSGPETVAHIHGPAAPGTNAPVLFPLPQGNFSDFLISLTPTDVQNLKDGLLYVNVHTNNFPAGEIRGQFQSAASASSIQFNAKSIIVTEGGGTAAVTVTRIGNTAGPASVSYATSDTAGLTNCNVINGIASSRCDYALSVGTVNFASGESFKTLFIPIVDDAYAEGSESFTITLSNPSATSIGPPSTATVTINDNETVNGPNPIDQTAFFVRQHYIDFLGREPDPAGFAGWQAIINNCAAGDTSCDRVHVSGAFYQSPEFQQRGYFVYRFYSVGFGRKPDYGEFIPDLARVSGFLTDTQLEAAKVAFSNEFVARPAFIARYPNALTATQYVDGLLSTAAVTVSNRQALIDALSNGMKTRAEVLRDIAESAAVSQKYFNEAFVVMQYFGYLRRDPDGQYLQWLQELNATGNSRNMINGFVNSLEYRFRFGLSQ